MQVKQTKSENLTRSYDVTVPASDVTKQLDQRLTQIGKTLKMPGFRPGKVPLAVVKKQHGMRVLGEILEQVVDNATRDAFKKEGIKPAIQPKIEIKEFEEGKDLKYSIEVEVLPDVPAIDVSKLEIEQPKIEVNEQDLTEALERLAGRAKEFVAVKDKRAAKLGDSVKIDFKGFVGDEAFEGGEAAGHQLELGSNSFIPGFEEQLVGTKAGDKKDVNVTFPEKYHSEKLAGKEARFEVTVHELLEAETAKVDDAFAAKVGAKDLDTLKGFIRTQMEQEVGNAVRARLKKSLFDQLEPLCDFPVPEAMVKSEFESIWQQLERARAEDPESPEFQSSEEELKVEYQAMAERRVKLGIMLAETGSKEKIGVTREELNQAIIAEARRYPGQESQVLEYFKGHPQAIEALKGPILEEKVVDFLLKKVKLKDKAMTLQELQDEAEQEATGKKSGKKTSEKGSSDKGASDKGSAKGKGKSQK